MYALSRQGRNGLLAAQWLHSISRGRRATFCGPHRFLGARHSSDDTTKSTTSRTQSQKDHIHDIKLLVAEELARPEETFPEALTRPEQSRLEERHSAEKTIYLKDREILDELKHLRAEELYEQARDLYRVLRNNDPSQILKTLGNRENKAIVARMRDSVFVSALLRLTPEQFVKPTVDTLKVVHPTYLERTKAMITVNRALRKFFEPLNQIIISRLSAKRKDGGYNSLGLIEFRHLLRIWASIGDLDTVDMIWETMKKFDIKPDLQCYNSLLHACVWEGAVHGLPRHKLRVTPYYYLSRNFLEPSRRYQGFGTGMNSVRKRVYETILEMMSAELPLDEETYVNMLLASARVGHRESINNILRAVWGIDARAIVNAEPENKPAAKSIPKSSPLYPSEKLLFAVAHAYARNSMFREAVQVTQYISEQYGIEIKEEVYAEFVEMAFVLSRKRGYDSRDEEQKLGQVDTRTVWNFKDMLQLDGRSFHDMDMYRLFARNAATARDYWLYIQLIREAYKMLGETRRARNHALRVLESYLGISLRIETTSQVDESLFRKRCSTPHVWRAMQKYDKLRLLAEQQQKTLERIAKYGVVFQLDPFTRFYTTNSHRRKLTLQILPKFIAEWRDFLPETFGLILPNQRGRIYFIGRTRYGTANHRMHNNEPVRWSDCGGDILADEDQVIEPSHDVLWAHLKARLDVLADVQPFAWFFNKSWTRPPVLVTKADDMEHEFEGLDEELDSAEERPHLLTEVDGMKDEIDGSNQEVSSVYQGKVAAGDWAWLLDLKLDHTRKHAHYVTMEPLFTPASL